MNPYLKIISNLENFLREYVDATGYRSIIVGISGGIDSAVTAAIASRVCVSKGIPLIGRYLPIDDAGDKGRAIAVGSNFCTEFKEVDLTDTFHSMINTFDREEYPIDAGKVKEEREGKLKTRLRMMYLNNIACQRNSKVLSTNNHTEYLIGGKIAAEQAEGLSLIRGLWKTEVYEVAKALIAMETQEEKIKALQDCVNAPVDDEVYLLGASRYSEIDITLKEHIRGDLYSQEEALQIVSRYEEIETLRKMPGDVTREVALDGVEAAEL